VHPSPTQAPTSGVLRAGPPLVSPSGELGGEAPVTERGDQPAARVGGIRLRMAPGAERDQTLGALDDVMDLEADAQTAAAGAPSYRHQGRTHG